MAKSKKSPPIVTLKKFLTELAQDAEKLGKFIQDPEKAMKTAGLSPEDQAALRSGFPGVIYARLAGLPIEEAFKIPPSKRKLPPLFPFHPNWPSGLVTGNIKPIRFPELLPYFHFQPPPFYWGKPSGPPKAKAKSKTKPKSIPKSKRKVGK
jgi:hypothetical protein